MMKEPGIEFWAAIAAFKKEGLEITKDTKVSFGQTNYTHAKLEDILVKIAPALEKHGLLISHAPSTVDGLPALTMYAVHLPSEQCLVETSVLPLSKHDPQAGGSAITYYRRYSIGALLGLHLVEDDDARKATFDDEPKKTKKVQTPKIEGLVTHDALVFVVEEIKKAKLDAGQSSALKAWLKDNNISLGKKDSSTGQYAGWTLKEDQIEDVVKQLSSIKEPL